MKAYQHKQRTRPTTLTRVANQVHQGIIKFTFANEEFDVHCQIEGVQTDSLLFNALTAQLFIPIYNLNDNSYEFVTPEHLGELIPASLMPQTI